MIFGTIIDEEYLIAAGYLALGLWTELNETWATMTQTLIDGPEWLGSEWAAFYSPRRIR
jgi:hypothetical protein